MFRFLKQKRLRKIALALSVYMLASSFLPSITYALTSGPTTPEVHGFEPVGTTQMVDLFSGDFTYNIPLMELPGSNGGYPFNLAYHAGVSMDQEASWTGLGWSLNPGALTRQMRGIPDDFAGEEIKKEIGLKKNTTTGGTLGGSIELFGVDGDMMAKLSKGLKKGDDRVSSIGSVSGALSIYYNNYRGVGVSLDHSFGITPPGFGGFGVSASMSTDSQNGVRFTPSLSYSKIGDNFRNRISAGLSFSSQGGLENAFYSGSRSATTELSKERKMLNKKHTKSGAFNISSSGSTAINHNGYTPSVSMPMESFGITAEFKLGLAFAGVYGSGSAGMFHRYQEISDDKLAYNAYGYNYLEQAIDSNKPDSEGTDGVMMDFNRVNDGAIYKESTHLPSPVTNYDIYNATGQGMAGMYRPFRKDFTLLIDPEVSSSGSTYDVGVDLDIVSHVGVNYADSFNEAISGPWKDDDSRVRSNVYEQLSKQAVTGDAYKMFAYGDFASRPVGYYNEDIVNGKPTVHDLETLDEEKLKEFAPHSEQSSNNVQAFTVKYLRGLAGQEFGNIAGELIKWNEASNTAENYSIPDNVKDTQIGAYITTNTDGVRYVYAQPAYNTKHVQASFSVKDQGRTKYLFKVGYGYDESNGSIEKVAKEYLQKTEMNSPYAYAYMLTSVLGTDYVDADNIPGPSKGDLGYWVKFTYEPCTNNNNNFKWRSPLSGASYDKGYLNDPNDDMGSYLYGEKEIYFLSKAETNSHVIVFNTKDRKDAFGVKSENRTNPEVSSSDLDLGLSQQKLTSIKLYTRSEYERYIQSEYDDSNTPTPIKTAHFEYEGDNGDEEDRSLCSGVENGNGDVGKLTLKKLWFTYGKSDRGKLTPYEFKYGQYIKGNGSIGESNPGYNDYQKDRWGNYKEVSSEKEAVVHPYVNQYTSRNTFSGDPIGEDQRAKEAAAWNLTQVTLPSGAKMRVAYEPDDYAFVQNKPAMYMTKVWGRHSSLKLNGKLGDDIGNKNPYIQEIEDRGAIFSRSFLFELPEGIESNLTFETYKSILFDFNSANIAQVYFNMKVDLQNDGNLWERVQGYANAHYNRVNYYGSRTVGETTVHYGIVQFDEIDGYDPVQMAAFQHVQVNEPVYTNGGTVVAPIGNNPGGLQLFNALNGLLQTIPNAIKMLGGFNRYAKSMGWGHINNKGGEAEECWIRIGAFQKGKGENSSPLLKKYGGGIRVKTIMMHDGWGSESIDDNVDWLNDINCKECKGHVYGQQYTYEKTGEYKGKEIKTVGNKDIIVSSAISLRMSSGVAANEPSIGGDENAIKQGLYYRKNNVAKNDSHFLVETPVNEQYYPGASVGYSEVQVTSIHTHNVLAKETDKDMGATGQTVHEFYTARDFPVKSSATKLKPYTDGYSGFEGFLRWTQFEEYRGVQSYMVELNDMHGKQKKVSYYPMEKESVEEDGIEKERYIISSSPSSYTEYIYKREGSKLKNKVDALSVDSKGKITKGKYLMKQKEEAFVDVRKSESWAKQTGVNVNVDMVGLSWLGIPVTVPLPSITGSRSETRTAVSNKVIHRFGILEKVIQFSEGSTVVQTNHIWDALTGNPVVTSVGNSFGETIYTYNIPAYFKYPEMGPAYRNSGLVLTLNLSRPNTLFPNYYQTDSNGDLIDKLVSGDEFITANGDKITYIGKRKVGEGNIKHTFFSKAKYEITGADMLLYRSGYRNQLSASIGSISTRKDITKDNALLELNEDTGSEVSEDIDFPTERTNSPEN